MQMGNKVEVVDYTLHQLTLVKRKGKLLKH